MINKFAAFLLFILLSYTQVFSQYSLRENIAEGVVFHKVELKGPIAVQYLEVELTNEHVKVSSVLANGYLGNGGEGVSQMCERLRNKGINVIGGINGDFFGCDPHRVLNSMISDGKYIKGAQRSKSLFGLLENGKPFIEKLKFAGEIILRDTALQLKYLNDNSRNSTAVYNRFYNRLFAKDSLNNYLLLEELTPFAVNDTGVLVVWEISHEMFTDTLDENEYLIADLKELEHLNLEIEDTVKMFLGTDPDVGSIIELIGGMPRLVIDGMPIQDFLGVEGLTSKWFIGKNPRTAVGFNADSTKLFLVTVDGRQNNYSVGMTLPELAEFMVSIGCYQAVNLDGGGSTTMWVDGNIENSPSDKTGERPVHNGIIVYIE